MTPEQQKALALARARRRRQEALGGAPQWSPQQDADLAEQIAGTGTFADMTGSGIVKAVPFGDEIASALNAPFRAARDWWQGDGFDVGRAYDRNMQVEAELQRRRQERSPIASTVGSVAGTLGATAPIAQGASFLRGAQPTLTSMAGRGAAEGATYGAAYGAGEGRGLEERGYNALFGAGLGAATGALTGAIGSIGAGRQANASVPSVDDLRAAGQAAYQQADQAGVIFSPQAVDRLKMDVGKKLVDLGYDPALQPGAAAVVKRIDDLAGQNFTLTGLDSLRKVASNGYITGNRSNNKAISDIVNAIDDLVTSPRATDVLTGDTKLASEALSTAREMWSRLSKAERVSDAIGRAELRASSTGSGGNVDNAIRQNLRRILENPRGFTQAEQDALRKVVSGSAGQNALRLAGKLSPSGNGLMAALGIGGTMVNPAIGLASLGGMGAKAVADNMTRQNTQVLDALIRSGGQSTPALSAIRQAIVDALIRGSASQLPASTGG
ncbi:hypothetical protein QEZ48_10730 [Aquamicrobium lusatiense]|uniref:hypothetical protein n=1 Tax=Aquamicrobium lusatiense TaxID=89772 RepID=UPI0024578559|nr:hypothetical protein [Aquamicrobium lusatiense]MDH4991297.1 hypothetical protein [Aquamicrobium lusatiense]